jgi:hypothetical protein
LPRFVRVREVVKPFSGGLRVVGLGMERMHDDAHLRDLAEVLQKELEPGCAWIDLDPKAQEKFLVIATRLATTHKAALLSAVLDEIDAKA